MAKKETLKLAIKQMVDGMKEVNETALKAPEKIGLEFEAEMDGSMELGSDTNLGGGLKAAFDTGALKELTDMGIEVTAALARRFDRRANFRVRCRYWVRPEDVPGKAPKK